MQNKIVKKKSRLQIHRLIRLGAFLGLLFLFCAILLKTKNMLLSSLLALVLSYLFDPAVILFERLGIKRNTSILVVFLVASMGLILLGVLLAPFLIAQTNSLQAELPKYIDGTTKLIYNLESKIQSLFGETFQFNIHDPIKTFMVNVTGTLFHDFPAFISSSVTTLLLAPFFGFFILKDGQKAIRNWINLVPNDLFELTLNLYTQISEQMGQFVRARLLEAAIVGGVICIGLWMVQFPYASLLAAFAALCNLIPYVGPIIGAVPALAIALINDASTVQMTGMICIYLLAQLIDIAFVIPMIVAKLVDLHPVTVVIVIIIGAQLMGVLGMLISIPVASALKLTLYNLYGHLTDFRA